MCVRTRAFVWFGMGTAFYSLCFLVGCADTPRGADRSAFQHDLSQSLASDEPSKDPYADVNTVAHDRNVWQELLGANSRIRRTVRHMDNGVEAVTESDDPAVAAKIIEHAKAMHTRMKVGAQVRVWDPVFAELFKNHRAVSIEVTPTDKGVKIVEIGADPESVTLLRSHAMGVNDFVREGMNASPRKTAKLRAGAVLPASELAIGGVPHRILLTPPNAEQLAELKSAGVTVVINFCKSKVHPEFNEQLTANNLGLTYHNLGVSDPAEITDDQLDSARAAIRAADEQGEVAALHGGADCGIGPAWVSYRTLDKGVALEQALSEARAMDMLDPRAESLARDYFRRKRASAG